MGEIFLRLVNQSIAAGYAVCAILVLRMLFRKAPKWMICLLWSLTAVRLLIPFSLKSVLSLIPSAQPIPSDFLLSDKPAVHFGITVVDQSFNPIIAESLKPNPAASINPAQTVIFVASWIWLAGMILMIGYACISSCLLMYRLSTATLLQKGVKESACVESPFVFGIFRPMIYLPYQMREEDRKYVLAHEWAHIRRKDHWWKLLGFFLLAVYWFHPLLWIAYRFFCKDMEAACDEKVIRELGMEERKAYARALLHCSVHRRKAVTACPLAFGEHPVKSRIKGVMDYQKPAFWILVLSAAVFLLAAVCFLTDPKSEVLLEEESAEPLLAAEDDFQSFAGEYWMLSGAGAWQTRLYLYADGSFCGLYEDADAGRTYRCVFQGQLALPEEKENGTLDARILTLAYEEPGVETQEGEATVVTSTPYGLEQAEMLTLYRSGYSISELPEEAYSWLAAEREEFWDKSQQDAMGMTLPCTAFQTVQDDGLYLFSRVSGSFLSDPSIPSFANKLQSSTTANLSRVSDLFGQPALEYETVDASRLRYHFLYDSYGTPVLLAEGEYASEDLDGDGVPELVVQELWSDGGQAVKVFQRKEDGSIWYGYPEDQDPASIDLTETEMKPYDPELDFALVERLHRSGNMPPN